MEPEALVLLDGEREAQRLVVTWPKAAIREGGDEEEMFLYWSEISGVDIEDIQRWHPILFTNGILGPGGWVAHEAQAFIAQVVNRRVQKPVKER